MSDFDYKDYIKSRFTDSNFNFDYFPDSLREKFERMNTDDIYFFLELRDILPYYGEFVKKLKFPLNKNIMINSIIDMILYMNINSELNINFIFKMKSGQIEIAESIYSRKAIFISEGWVQPLIDDITTEKEKIFREFNFANIFHSFSIELLNKITSEKEEIFRTFDHAFLDEMGQTLKILNRLNLKTKILPPYEKILILEKFLSTFKSNFNSTILFTNRDFGMGRRSATDFFDRLSLEQKLLTAEAIIEEKLLNICFEASIFVYNFTRNMDLIPLLHRRNCFFQVQAMIEREEPPYVFFIEDLEKNIIRKKIILYLFLQKKGNVDTKSEEFSADFEFHRKKCLEAIENRINQLNFLMMNGLK